MSFDLFRDSTAAHVTPQGNLRQRNMIGVLGVSQDVSTRLPHFVLDAPTVPLTAGLLGVLIFGAGTVRILRRWQCRVLYWHAHCHPCPRQRQRQGKYR